MQRIPRTCGTALMLAFTGWSCADLDNPVALSELDPTVEFEIEAARIETLEEVEVHVHVTESGMHLKMLESHLEIQHEAGGDPRIVEMAPEGEGYAAHVIFYEAGEHHLHFVGVPERHRLSWEMGDHEIDAHRQHEIIGPYWVEMDVSPAPVMEHTEAHIHLHVHELLPDGTAGDEVGRLELEVEAHNPDGTEATLLVNEDAPGEYEVAYEFGEAGTYELHVEIEVNGVHEEGEFHIPVLGEVVEGEDVEQGGHGHGPGS